MDTLLRLLTGVGCVVVGITGHQSSSMETAAQNKLDFGNPILDRIRFGLTAFIVLLEVVGKIAIQIEATGIVPGNQRKNYEK